MRKSRVNPVMSGSKTTDPNPIRQDLSQRNAARLFDESVGYDDETGVRVAAGLSSDEMKQAATLYNLFNELWGLVIVVGVPGTGKDTFGNYLSHRLKRYFPWKRIWRDEMPRALYGPYAGLFNDQVLVEDLERMREAAKGVGATKIDAALEKAADDWVTSKGTVMLKTSVLYLTEFWRYCYRRTPHSPMNKTMGGIHKVKRHLDTLIIGTVQLPGDLDRKTCLPFVDWQVTCARSARDTTRFTFFVRKVKYDKHRDILEPIGKPFPIPVDAGKPRSFLGDGKIVVRKHDYEPQSEEERVVLEALEDGLNSYEELVNELETHGDMEEWETLATLKELKFRRTKRVIDYPCDFGLFNSKSAPQIHTSLKDNRNN